MAVGAENEWHPNHDTRNTVRYYGKNKVWYQTTLPPSILKCSLLLPTQRKKSKRKKKQKICRSPFSSTPRFSHSPSSCLVSLPPRYRLRERKIKLSPLLIKTSLVGNALCIFGLGNTTSYPARSDLSMLLYSRRRPSCCQFSSPSWPCLIARQYSLLLLLFLHYTTDWSCLVDRSLSLIFSASRRATLASRTRSSPNTKSSKQRYAVLARLSQTVPATAS